MRRAPQTVSSAIETHDVRVVRQYLYKNINVLVEIDYARKTVSLVEPTNNGSASYLPKKWLFAERGLPYMQGWLDILTAMQLAVSHAKSELESKNEDEFEAMLHMLANNKLGEAEVL